MHYANISLAAADVKKARINAAEGKTRSLIEKCLSNTRKGETIC
jgi:hypothetical protein